ncbi:MAG: HAD family hydrolase [Candidatus Altiarchaeales archaeon]|nr:HAD family hydrolase [Candidatus Altiarchaeales archaeon]
MIKAVLFDFDGTLIDSVDSVWREYQRTAGVLNLPERKFEDFARQLGKPWEEALENLWPGVDKKRFTEVYRLEREEAKLIEGVSEALSGLKGKYKLGILTSRGSKTLYQHLDSTGIDFKMFEIILHKESLANHKPHPEALLQACRQLEVNPREAVYIGDSIVDAQCAINAGMKFIGVLTGGASRKDFTEAGLKKEDILKSLKNLPEEVSSLK